VKKDLLMMFFGLLLTVVLFGGTKIQSVEDYYQTHVDDIQEDSETITLSIRCDAVLENYERLDDQLQDPKYVPEDGTILPETKYVLRPKDSVFDLLVRATRHEQIQMEYQGAGENLYGSAYILGIHHIYEFSCGPLSGWMYRVNGEYPSRGCSRYLPVNGDHIEFIYTCDLGRDIGGYFLEQKENKELHFTQ